MGERLIFTFALTGRREWGHGTQGVALGYGLAGLSARAGPHNRLLRRQHCSSLCKQSELQCCAADHRRMFAQRLMLLCRYAI